MSEHGRSNYDAELLADAPRLAYEEGSAAILTSYQKAMLGCILADPGEAGKVAFAELDDSSFPDPLCSKAFAIARDLSAQNLPIAADTVEAELIERHPDLPIDAISLRSFLLSVVPYIEGPWTDRYYVEKLKAATRSKDLARMFRQSADWVEAGQDYDGNPVGADDVADILREVVEERREHDRQPALSLEEFLQSPPKKPRSIWGDLICAGEGTLIAAEPKLGKTMWTQKLALAIAGGASEFLGHSVTPGRILLLQAEVHPAYYLERLATMLDHAATAIDVKRAKKNLIVFPDGFLALSASHGQNGVGQRIQRNRAFLEIALVKWRPDVLILDPLYILFPNVEVGLEDSGEVFAYLNRLRMDYGCALVLAPPHKKAYGLTWRFEPVV